MITFIITKGTLSDCLRQTALPFAVVLFASCKMLSLITVSEITNNYISLIHLKYKNNSADEGHY